MFPPPGPEMEPLILVLDKIYLLTVSCLHYENSNSLKLVGLRGINDGNFVTCTLVSRFNCISESCGKD